MGVGIPLDELPEDNIIPINPPPDGLDRVGTTNKVSSRKKADSIEMVVVKSYAQQHIESMNKLASAFSIYMQDLSALQNTVFMTAEESEEE